jgi:hypothetical protein
MTPTKPPLSTITRLTCAGLLALCACSSDESGPGGEELPPGETASYSVSGKVLDLETGQAVAGSATVTVDGVSPAPTVSINGSDFVIDDIPANSAFHLLAGSPPAYRATYNAAVEVGESDINGVELYVVREEYLAQLATAFNVSPTLGTGIIIARAVGQDGQPYEGLPGTEFDLPTNIQGPFFLDANLQPDAQLSSTSASGFVVFFDVEPGVASLAATDGASHQIAMATSPVAASAVTFATLTVVEGETIPLPQNVSFSNDVAPIFESRGCVNCHDGGGIGKDLGGLHLNGASEKMFKELTEEVSPSYGVLRIDRVNPENSLLLTMPSFEDPADSHPFATFTGSDDPDYLIVLTWIKEGAKLN